MIPEIDVRGSLARNTPSGDLGFECEADAGLLDIPFTSFASPVQAQLRYEIHADESVEVWGTVAFTLRGECSRCLAGTERRILSDAEGTFFPGPPKGGEYGYTGGKVRLGEFLRDAVAFALPLRLLCRDCERDEDDCETDEE